MNTLTSLSVFFKTMSTDCPNYDEVFLFEEEWSFTVPID